jgi:uncharacterized protein with von Willebrand factor type A (vWA) domain
VLGFARTLRVAGVGASPDRVEAMLAAVAALDVLDATAVYWSGRLTLAAGPDDLDRYDAAFAAFFARRGAAAGRPAPSSERWPQRAVETTRRRGGRREPGGPRPGQRRRGAAAPRRRRPDRAEREHCAGCSRCWSRRPRCGLGRRRPPRTARSTRRTVRRACATAARYRLLYRAPPAARAGGLLVDVSGSISPYADALLRFAHAAVRAHPGVTEVFTIGTRLTRVTREMRLRDPDRALAASGAAIPDWSGGTRLGEVLKAFLDRWGQRGTARGAVVVVCSDGWERGDTVLLAEQMVRLRRLAHAVVWVNPHKGRIGYEPLTGGMQAALPSVDVFVSGHSLAAFEELAGVIARA